MVQLDERTRQDNARFLDSPEQVPVHCLTQGIATIIGARHLLLIAQGEHKAPPVLRTLRGPVTEEFPASIIQRHPRFTVVMDGGAASLLGDASEARRSLEGLGLTAAAAGVPAGNPAAAMPCAADGSVACGVPASAAGAGGPG